MQGANHGDASGAGFSLPGDSGTDDEQQHRQENIQNHLVFDGGNGRIGGAATTTEEESIQEKEGEESDANHDGEQNANFQRRSNAAGT